MTPSARTPRSSSASAATNWSVPGRQRSRRWCPWRAWSTSMVSFALGPILPLLAISLTPTQWRVPVTFAAVLVALALTGSLSAHFGGGSHRRSVVRLVVGGALSMLVTYGIGKLIGRAV